MNSVVREDYAQATSALLYCLSITAIAPDEPGCVLVKQALGA